MGTSEMQNMFASQQAVLIYEIIILAVLLIVIVLLSKKRKARKMQREIQRGKQEKQALDAALTNQNRRN